MPDGSVNSMRCQFRRRSKRLSRGFSTRRFEYTGPVEQMLVFTPGGKSLIFFWIANFPHRVYNMEPTDTYPKTYG
jgi:hypothetical protein